MIYAMIWHNAGRGTLTTCVYMGKTVACLLYIENTGPSGVEGCVTGKW